MNNTIQISVTPEGIERLKMTYEMLQGIPSKRVNLKSWRVGMRSDRQLLHDCGTTACAVGWACAYPPFKEMGLHFNNYTPEYRGASNWRAVQNFYGTDYFTLEALFQDCESPSIKHRFLQAEDHNGNDRRTVLARIRLLLEHVGAITSERSDDLRRIEAK